MDGSRFDDFARSLVTTGSRRGFLGGLLALGAGLAGFASADAACPPGQVSVRGQCRCKQTGRPPVGGVCPCPNGQSDTGDGQGCVACHADGDCGASNECVAWSCAGGSCRRTPRVCDDGQGLCTTKTCDPVAGCLSTPIPCDDGDACTLDSCDPGSGCVHTPVSCDDGDRCTVDACDAATGCVHTQLDCDDNNACTDDSCDSASGCVYEAISCDDNNACTSDSCDAATGCAHTAVVCDSGDACVVDSCDSATGCVQTPVDDDQQGGCQTGEVCCGGACTPLGTDENCGACGDACIPGQPCANGTCDCTPTSPQVITGALTGDSPVTGSCVNGNTSSPSYFYDPFAFVHCGGPLSIELLGEENGGGTLGDPYLELYAGSFDPLDTCATLFDVNDDFCGTDSGLAYGDLDLPPGNYVVLATTFNGFETGSYTLRFNQPLTPC